MKKSRFVTDSSHIGSRLDVILHDVMPEHSRSFFQKLIKQGAVTLDGHVVTKSSYVLAKPGMLEVTIASGGTYTVARERIADMGVTLIAEYPEFIIINKPAGLVVHKPAHTSEDVTLVDWILSRYPDIAQVGQPGRPGIVHRLDKQTSGLMIIARTSAAYTTFIDLFKERKVAKTYSALVVGHPEKKFTVAYAIRRHPTQPTKMASSRSDGKQAHTDFVVSEYLTHAALIMAYPKTGRTHQIRVHCASVGHPILGDIVYGHKSPLIDRQALHAQELRFEFTGKKFVFESALPADIQQALIALRP